MKSSPNPSIFLRFGFISVLMTLSQTTFSHATMTSSIPDKESSISGAVPAVIVCFNEDIGDEHRALTVIGESGNRFDTGPIEQINKDQELCLKKQLKSLSPDNYLVRYRALSSDGHVISGKYNFSFTAK